MKLNIENKRKFNLVYVLITFFLIMMIQNFLASYTATEHLLYSESMKLVKSVGEDGGF